MSTKKAEIAELDQWFPPRGACAMCGHKDARHRLWDMVLDSDEEDEWMARNYDVSVEAIQAVRRIRPYRRSR